MVRYRQICEKYADIRDFEYEQEMKHEPKKEKTRLRAAFGDVMEIAEHLNIPPDEAAYILGSNIRKRGSGV
ncbi:unnamed protein product [Dracunculus medinensis]|uniref:XRE family transcriptional regulator n=1 Tax=Dracunculus medinensis TaxID=318479 RepID=A0A0N4U0W9_DRAME|nr:unnamed protein product [Dracunculus medinensis]